MIIFFLQLEVETEIKQLIMYLLDPIFHGVNMVLLLVTAITYFVLPQLRDLLGNFVTSLSLCLIVVYAADLVRLYRGLSEHVSFLAAGRIVTTSITENNVMFVCIVSRHCISHWPLIHVLLAEQHGILHLENFQVRHKLTCC
jgi:hypothetical protein